MAKQKLKTFTVSEFHKLLAQHDNKLADVARVKGVTLRGMQKWVSKHCPRKVIYVCQQEQPS